MTKILIFFLLSNCLYAAQNNNSEIKALSKDISKYDKLSELYLQRGKLYKEEKKFQKASQDINRAICINPEFLEAKLLLAEVYIKQKKNLKAKVLLDEFLKDSKNKDARIKVYTFLGDLLMLEEEYEDAVEEYQKIFTNSSVHTQEQFIKMAEALYESGEYAKSISFLKEGLTTIIEKDTLKLKMIELSSREGNYSLALAMLDQMLIEDKDNKKLKKLKIKVLKMKEKGDSF